MPDETKPDPPKPETKPEPPYSKEEAEQLLNLFVTTAMNSPDSPAILLMTAKPIPVSHIRAVILSGMPYPWHNAVSTYMQSHTDDEVRLLACLFAVVFVQGAGMRRLMQQQNRNSNHG
jgi:hypothetical protein